MPVAKVGTDMINFGANLRGRGGGIGIVSQPKTYSSEYLDKGLFRRIVRRNMRVRGPT